MSFYLSPPSSSLLLPLVLSLSLEKLGGSETQSEVSTAATLACRFLSDSCTSAACQRHGDNELIYMKSS